MFPGVSDNLTVPVSTTATKSSLPAAENIMSQITSASDPVSSFLRKAVTESELDILSQLKSDSLLLKLAKDARDARLIPLDVVENLEMMAPSGEKSAPSISLKCRYVMMHICKAIRAEGDSCEGNKFYNFVKLFNRHIVCNQFEQCVSQRHSDLGRPSSQAQVFHDILPETRLDVETHLSKLHEALIKYSYLWEEIGIALNFVPCDFERIKAVRMNGINMRLYDILSEWLSQSHNYLKPPTFGTLAEVLRSAVVNHSRLVDDVRETLRAPARPRNYQTHIEERNVSMNTSPNLNIELCVDNKLCEKEVAVLMEFQVKNLSPHRIKYEWSKDGKSLKHSDLDHNDSILCVRIKNVRAEGEYRVSFGEEMIESEVIKVCVRTMLCKYASRVRGKYQLQPEIKSDTWHEVHQHTYINLAVVGEGGRLSHKCYQETIRGDADDVLKPKARIDYQDAFRDIKYGDRVLVVGRPGSGKTTLVHRITQDWANSSILTNYKILFLIPLRGLPITNVELFDLVKCHIKDQEVNKVCEYIDQQEGLGVCFILDGLDEYKFDKDGKIPNFILQLIKGDKLPGATVIVASRPAAYTYSAKRTVEVLGFLKDQIVEYINSYQFKSDSKSSKLTNYLESHSNIRHMCYLPVQAAMVCFIFDCEEDVSDTETGIYLQFTKQTVMRAIHKKGKSCQYLESLHDLPEKPKKYFFEICRVAFEMTCSSEQIFSRSKAKSFNIDDSLGLVTIDRVLSLCGFKESYSFCHLTFQEFLSAYHISSLEVEEQLRIIKECGPMKHMYMVFKFYCGLVTFEMEDVRFKTLIEVAQFNTLHKVHCCFESQQPSTCDLVADGNRIIIDDDFSTPIDFACLGYVVSNAVKNPVRILKLYDVVADEDCCEEFKRIVNGSKYAVDIIDLSDANYLFVENLNFARACSPFIVYCRSENDVNSLLKLECLSKVETLPSVEIICFSIFDSHINLQNLQEDFKKICPQLRTVGLPGLRDCIKMKVPSINNFSVQSTSLCTFMNQSFQRAEVFRISYDLRYKYYRDDDFIFDGFVCTHLTLFNCDLNNETAALLAEGLRFNSGVKVLKLVANDIGDEGAVAIAASINGHSSLRHLDLSLNKIADTGAAALMKWIESDCGFNLHLCGNNISDSFVAGVRKGDVRDVFQVLEITDIGDDGLARIDSIMNRWTLPLCTVGNIQSLYLQSSRKSIGDIKLIRNMLPRLVSLRSLSFVDMNMSDEGMSFLFQSFLWNNITLLNLSHNLIGDGSIEGKYICISSRSLSTSNITDLNLSHNKMGDNAAPIIAFILGVQLTSSVVSYSGSLPTESLHSCSKLERLYLSSNSIGATGALSLSILMKQVCKTLEVLDLSCNSLSDVGCVCLSGGLKYCSCLKQLHLSSNCIGVMGVESVVKALENSDLSELSLAGNLIKDRGAMALAKSLQTCSQLTSLDLSHNEIGDSGACCLGDCLRHCSKLHTLRLNSNQISGIGAVRIAEGVACGNLEELELGYNFLWFEDVQSIVIALKDSTRIKRLVVCSDLTDLLLDFSVYKHNDGEKFWKCIPNCNIIVCHDYNGDIVLHNGSFSQRGQSL